MPVVNAASHDSALPSKRAAWEVPSVTLRPCVQSMATHRSLERDDAWVEAGDTASHIHRAAQLNRGELLHMHEDQNFNEYFKRCRGDLCTYRVGCTASTLTASSQPLLCPKHMRQATCAWPTISPTMSCQRTVSHIRLRILQQADASRSSEGLSAALKHTVVIAMRCDVQRLAGKIWRVL